MSAIIKTLKTTTNDVEQSVYPKTVLEAVVDTDTNQTLDVILDNIKSDTPNGSAYVDFNEQSGEVTGEVEAVTSAKLVSYSNTESGIEATNVQDAIDTVSSISKGKNRARVFATTEDMNNWLKNEANKGIANVGDNLYIVELDVPDWWISEVLEEADADTGFYYKIAQLETQKVDLTNIESSISNIETRLITGASLVNHDFNDLGDKPLIGIGNKMTNDPLGNTSIRYHVVHIPAYNNYETVQYAKPINYGSGTLLFFRQQKHDGAWSEWTRFATDNDIATISSNMITCEGGSVYEDETACSKRWYKYSDGRMVVVMSKQINNIAIKTQFGGIYTSDAIEMPDFPTGFTGTPYTQITSNRISQAGGTSFVLPSGIPSATNPGSIQLARGTALDYGSANVIVHAEGRWK